MGKTFFSAAIALHLAVLGAKAVSAQPVSTQDSLGFSVEQPGWRLGEGELREPLSIAAGAEGHIFVADAMAGKVFRLKRGEKPVEFDYPWPDPSLYPLDLAVYGAFVYVLDYTRNSILRYDHHGTYLDVLLTFKTFDRTRPGSISGGPGGLIATTDMENQKIVVWSPLLEREIEAGEYGSCDGCISRPSKAIVLPDGTIAVAELGNRRVQIFSPSGVHQGYLTLPGDREWVSPRSLCSDEKGNVFVADTGAGTVHVFGPGGRYMFGLDSFDGKRISPAAVALDWDDRLYVADLESRSILVYDLKYPD